MKIKQRHRKLIFDVLAVIIALLSVVLIYVGLQSFLATSRPIVITGSGSMSPAIEMGDIVVVQGVSASSIQVGDIIVFEEPNIGELTIHRVIQIETREDGSIYFTTKGDANPSKDSRPVSATNVYGRVIYRIPYVGYIAIHPAIPIAISIGIIMLLFLWPEKKKKSRRKRSKPLY